jgi:hypothetical protein
MVCGSDREVAARIWQGVTEDGIPVHCYVTRIVPEVPKSSPCIEALTARFKRELMRCADGRPAVEAIPLRMII